MQPTIPWGRAKANLTRLVKSFEAQPSEQPVKAAGPPGWFEDHGPAPRQDAEAIERMRAAYKASPDGEAMLTAWIDRILEDQAKSVRLTVMGHSAITLLLRRGTFAASPELVEKLHKALSTSWLQLTGKLPAEDQRLERLPRQVLSGADRLSRAFHTAVFQPDDVRAAKADPGVVKDYVPEKQDAGYVLLVLAALTTEAGLELIGGGAIGTAISTYLESFLHDHGAHATKKTRAWVDAAGIKGYVGQRVTEAWYSHTFIHHAATYRKDHVTQFSSATEKAELDAKLLARGAEGQKIIEEGYGVTVANRNVLPYLQPYLAAAVAVAVGFKLTPLVILGMTLPIIAPPFASKFLHPYLHMKNDDALAQASPLMRLLLSSRYVELVKMLHYLHHNGGGGNFNIEPPLGDWARGELHRPNVKKMIEMYDLGMNRSLLTASSKGSPDL